MKFSAATTFIKNRSPYQLMMRSVPHPPLYRQSRFAPAEEIRHQLPYPPRQKLEDRFIGNAYMFTEEERKKLLKIKTDAPSPAEVVKTVL